MKEITDILNLDDLINVLCELPTGGGCPFPIESQLDDDPRQNIEIMENDAEDLSKIEDPNNLIDVELDPDEDEEKEDKNPNQSNSSQSNFSKNDAESEDDDEEQQDDSDDNSSSSSSSNTDEEEEDEEESDSNNDSDDSDSDSDSNSSSSSSNSEEEEDEDNDQQGGGSSDQEQEDEEEQDEESSGGGSSDDTEDEEQDEDEESSGSSNDDTEDEDQDDQEESSGGSSDDEDTENEEDDEQSSGSSNDNEDEEDSDSNEDEDDEENSSGSSGEDDDTESEDEESDDSDGSDSDLDNEDDTDEDGDGESGESDEDSEDEGLDDEGDEDDEESEDDEDTDEEDEEDEGDESGDGEDGSSMSDEEEEAMRKAFEEMLKQINNTTVLPPLDENDEIEETPTSQASGPAIGNIVAQFNAENYLNDIYNVIRQLKEKMAKVPMPNPTRRTITGKVKPTIVQKGFMRNDGRFFEKHGGSNRSPKSKGQKTFLLLVIDKSDSMEENIITINKMLYTIYKAWKLIPDLFDYEVLLTGSNICHLEKGQWAYATEGTCIGRNFSRMINEYRKPHVDAGEDVHTLILFDGYWGYMEVPQYLSDAEQMEFARKNYVRAATDNTTTWIVDCSCNAELEECFSKDIFKKRVKVLSNYVETLVKTVTDILSGIVNKL